MEPIYLDHAATTPMRAEVREAMLPSVREAAAKIAAHTGVELPAAEVLLAEG